MPSLSGSFSATGQTSATLMLKPGQSATYSLATWTRTAGFVALQKMATGGGAWETLASYTANQSSTVVRNDSGVENQFYRILCKTADTLDYTLADVTGEAMPGTSVVDSTGGEQKFYCDDSGYLRATGFKTFAGGFTSDVISNNAAGAVSIGATGGAQYHIINGLGLNLTTAATATESVIYKTGNDGSVRILGGQASAGGNLVLYGSTNAKAATGELRTSATVRFAWDGTGIGFFATAPVAKQAHIADATDATDVITRANAILTALRNYGLLATS